MIPWSLPERFPFFPNRAMLLLLERKSLSFLENKAKGYHSKSYSFIQVGIKVGENKGTSKLLPCKKRFALANYADSWKDTCLKQACVLRWIKSVFPSCHRYAISCRFQGWRCRYIFM
jgi:hypothetical protein